MIISGIFLVQETLFRDAYLQYRSLSVSLFITLPMYFILVSPRHYRLLDTYQIKGRIPQTLGSSQNTFNNYSIRKNLQSKISKVFYTLQRFSKKSQVMPVFEQLYTQKCHQLNQLNEHFIAYQDEATKIIEQLQASNQELKRKYERFETEFSNERDKRNMQINLLQKELKFIKKEKDQITCKYEDLQKNFISQENIFQTIQSENRAANYMLNQYEARVEKTMEELALLQIQLQESKQQSQELISRLKSQLRETQGQLYVLQLKYQKHNQQSELRRSGSSSTSGESHEEINQISYQNDFFKLKPMNLNLIQNIDIQKKREHSFMRTMNIVKNFISQFDEKTGKIKEKIKLSKRITRA